MNEKVITRPDILENLGSAEAVARAEKIADLNDKLRRGPHDMIVLMGDLAAHVDAMEPEEQISFQLDLSRTIAFFTDFTAENNPWGERDSAGFTFAGEEMRFKIDYYDTDGRYHSPDPTDPAVTKRVLAIYFTHDH